MNADRLISDVRHILDEQDLLGGTDIVDEDALPVDGRIRALYRVAMDETTDICPLPWLTAKECVKPDHTAYIGDGTGVVRLPSDFLRLAEFRMDGWRRSVDTLTEPDTDTAKYQLTGATRGGIVNPVCVADPMHTTMTYYSLPRFCESHKIAAFRYIPKASGIEGDTIDGRGYEVLTYVLARDVAESFGRDIQVLDKHIKELLQW